MIIYIYTIALIHISDSFFYEHFSFKVIVKNMHQKFTIHSSLYCAQPQCGKKITKIHSKPMRYVQCFPVLKQILLSASVVTTRLYYLIKNIYIISNIFKDEILIQTFINFYY